MIVTDLATIDRLAEEAYANKSIFSVDLADYANLKLSTDYLKAAKLETPSLTHECFDTITQLIQEMGTDGMEEIILHIICNGDHSSETASDGINLMARLTQEFVPNTCVLYGVSANDSTESSFTILLIAGYLEK